MRYIGNIIIHYFFFELFLISLFLSFSCFFSGLMIKENSFSDERSVLFNIFLAFEALARVLKVHFHYFHFFIFFF